MTRYRTALVAAAALAVASAYFLFVPFNEAGYVGGVDAPAVVRCSPAVVQRFGTPKPSFSSGMFRNGSPCGAVGVGRVDTGLALLLAAVIAVVAGLWSRDDTPANRQEHASTDT